MEWSDTGIILHVRPLGEATVVLSLFTAEHGRSSGCFRLSKQNRSWIHLGQTVQATWRARIETQLGQWRLEPIPSHVSLLLDHAGKLAALSSACSLCHLLLAEGHDYPQLFSQFQALILDLLTDDWARAYVLFEKSLLTDLGYGLDLTQCAVTGVQEGLVAVSPKSGRAVCAEAAKPYLRKLLPLPLFFLKNSEISLKELDEGLHLTGYFLERYAFSHLREGMPPARGRLLSYFERQKETAA